MCAVNFNSHAHVERDTVTRVWYATQIHFNSHAHVERDTFKEYISKTLGISTHTLTWSVT